MPPRKLTVGELAANHALGLKVVVEGDLTAQIRGAHAIEIDDAANWLEPGWLMLTTGLRFAGTTDTSTAQAKLVDQLVERHVPALLFGVGVHFSEVPHPLVRAARSAGLTVVSVAADVPFLQVEQCVSRSLLAADTAALQQRLALQNDLIESLGGDRPVVALVQRLSVLTKGTAVLYEESGRVVASTGDGPTALIWSEISHARRSQLRFTVGRWHVVARPVVLRGVGYWVTLASRREAVLDELAGPILEATQRLLGAIRGIRALSVAQSMAEAGQLIRVLNAGMAPDAAARTWDRMRAFRFEREHPVRAFVARALEPGTDRERPLMPAGARLGAADPADEAFQLAHDFGIPVLLVSDEDVGELRGLVGDSAILTEWTTHLTQAGFHMGLSEPFTELHLFRSRVRDAGRALRVAQRRAAYPEPDQRTATGSARVGTVLRFEDADMVTWLLSSRSSEAFTAKAQQQLGDLLTREDLVATLQMWFSCAMDVKATADALYLHPNSVRYRLRKVEEVIGAPLTSAAVIANLYIGLHEMLPTEA